MTEGPLLDLGLLLGEDTGTLLSACFMQEQLHLLYPASGTQKESLGVLIH